MWAGLTSTFNGIESFLESAQNNQSGLTSTFNGIERNNVVGLVSASIV